MSTATASKVHMLYSDDGGMFTAYLDGHVDIEDGTRILHEAILAQLGDDEALADYFPEGMPPASKLWLHDTGSKNEDGFPLYDWCLPEEQGAFAVTAVEGSPL